MARTASSTGFSVRWTMLCGLTFFTCHRSVALLGPKNWCAGAFPPAVEAPLVAAHEILARQHGMLLCPR